MASETWPLTTTDIEMLDAFEGKVFLTGPVRERGSWGRRDDNGIYKDPPVRSLIESVKLRRLGHVARMSESEILKKIFLGNPGGQRGRVRPRTR